MPSYDWSEYREASWRERFPRWVEGYAEWKGMPSPRAWEELDPVELLPDLARRDIEARLSENLACPRVFISHRQADANLALRAAWLARDTGFDYWLDVLDPDLNALQGEKAQQLTADEKAKAIAAIIEMALLNSTDVVALQYQRGCLHS